MAVSEDLRETLPLEIRSDASSGLPLLSEAGNLFDLVLAYLALPYSVMEFGCGKKASLILDYLVRLGIPVHALRRGLIMERDMSPAALAEIDPARRPHALIAENPLASLGEFSDPVISALLAEACPLARAEDGKLRAGPYLLSQSPTVQFVLARSHVFVTVVFWDEARDRATRLVIDPAVDPGKPRGPGELRGLFHAPEALIFEAPILERFHLDPAHLTDSQQRAIRRHLGDGEALEDLDIEDHAALVRQLTGAERGTIGDPLTWTYANNIHSEQLVETPSEPEDFRQHDATQAGATTRPPRLRQLVADLVRERERRGPDIPTILAAIGSNVRKARLREVLAVDAAWSRSQLEILADVAATLRYARSLGHAARRFARGLSLAGCLDDPDCVRDMRGVGVRLRLRIDRLADASRVPGAATSIHHLDEVIDARALGPGFIAASIETIRQMRAAGLRVTIDRVGNLHGLLIPDGADDGGALPATRLAHVSHIDTVLDAGKFDGRLGVLSGIETAHLLHDLHRHHHLPLPGDGRAVLQVSSFVGEEMTFTGEGISMPGSAAVTGRAEPAAIHRMTNAEGETWKDRLIAMLRQLREAKAAGQIDFTNDLESAGDDPEALLDACADPTEFFTPHTFERHIEQGPVLDRASVPLCLVDTIMGIHQEDFHFTGDRAEQAGSDLIGALRDLALEIETDAQPLRATCGVFEGFADDEGLWDEDLSFAVGCRLIGELNHAGSTPNADRADPGVAVSRLIRAFRDKLTERFPEKAGQALIGNLYLEPGTNRNVIPGAAGVCFGLPARMDLPAGFLAELRHHLEFTIVKSLSRPRAEGGENVVLQTLDDLSFVRVGRRVRLSLDLRFAREESCEAYLGRLGEICDDLCRSHGVRLQRETQQHLRPQHLANSGQVLLIERSYGGSHTPRETELLGDLIRASVLQIDSSRSALDHHLAERGFNLFHHVDRHIPGSWKDRLARFTSGALHDTCNVAAATRVPCRS